MNRTTCLTCAAPYAPALVGWSCPVCDTPAPGERPALRRWANDDDKLTAIVLAGTLLNITLLAALAAIVLSR